MSGALSLGSGTSVFSIAGVRFGFDVSLSAAGPLHLSHHFEPFRISAQAPPDVTLEVGVVETSAPPKGVLVYDSKLNWRLLEVERARLYEWYHPASGQVLMRVRWEPPKEIIEIEFDLSSWQWMKETHWKDASDSSLSLLPPFEQLPFLAPLAHRQAFLVHACGAVVDGGAYVFAGHSGDGKTTLARLLASEGVELLSDERVVIRKLGNEFVAYGTPWPGEGSVVSAAGFPLAGVFLLHKDREHRIGGGRKAQLATELLARCIVPYYLTSETELILSVLQEMARTIPLRELHFARSDGIAAILRRSSVVY